MADNIKLHIVADVDDKTGNTLKNIKGNLKEIPAEVTTKIKADGKQAKKEVDEVNKKLEQLNGKDKEIKVTATGTQALNTINGIKKSLSELPKTVSTKIDINAQEAKAQLDSIKKTLNSISKEVSTTVKLNHKQADTSIESYKKKLKDITSPVETKAKIGLDTRSALASLNSLNAKLKELKDFDLKVKLDVGGSKAVKELASGVQSLNKSVSAADKSLGKLKEISETLGKIDKNVAINVSINGAEETSNRLKEIYGLLRNIRRYSNVKVNANVSGNTRVQGQPQQGQGQGGFGSYESQIKDLVVRAEQAHMQGDTRELQRLRQEYILTTQEMLAFHRQFGSGDINKEIKAMTPIIQTLQRLGVLAQDDIGILRNLSNQKFTFDLQVKNSVPQTYAQLAKNERNLAEYSRQAGDVQGYERHLQAAAQYEAQVRNVNTDLSAQKTIQGQIESTLKEQIRAYQQIADAQRMRGDTRGLAQTEATLRQLQQEQQLARARQNPNVYKGMMQEADVYRERLANDTTLTPAARNQLRQQIIDTVSRATRQGLQDGMITNRQAVANYQRLLPSARQLGGNAEQNIQNEIIRLGGVGNNAGGQQANTARNEYNDLRRQAVQAIEDINRAWSSGRGTQAEEQRLNNILNRMREIRREAGVLNQSAEANLLTSLANGTQRGSRGYYILTERARQARADRQELRSDVGAGAGRSTPFGSWTNDFAYLVRFLGRSSKGVGSNLEATAQLMKDAQTIDTSAGLFARSFAKAVPVAGVISTIAIVFVGAIQQVVNGLQTFGNLLIQIGTTIYNALKPGIELFKTITASRFSFGASIISNGYDENGNRLSDTFKTNKMGVIGVSDQLISRAQFDAEMSAFSFQEILRSLQGTLPMLLSKGMSLNQAYDVNKGVAGVAKLIQLTPSQILQEARDLAQGSITARGSQVANALGVTNQDLAGKSADEIFNFLMEKFTNFTEFVNRFEDTAYGRAQQLEERLQTVTEKFVEQLSAGFQGIFENLIRFTGEWHGKGKDAEGKEVNATYDSITQKWTNDDTGEVLDKVNEVGDVVQAWHPDKQWFELSDVMREIGDSLKDIVEFTLDAGDAMLTFVEGATGISDPVEIAKTAIEGVITAFEFCFDVVATLIEKLFEFERPIMVAINMVKLLGLGFELVAEVIVSAVDAALSGVVAAIAGVFKAITKGYNFILGLLPDSVKSSLGLSAMGDFGVDNFMSAIGKANTNNAQHALKTLASIFDSNEYYGSYQDMFNKTTSYTNSGVENKHTLKNWWKQGYAKQEEKDRNKQNSPYSMNNVNGNPNPVDKDADKKAKAAQRAADKANREAIRESQRMLKERQQALKEILEDKLDRLKDLLKQNEISYKEGFTSITDYFKNKAELEKQEASARLQEALEEKSAIEQSQFNSPYEKLTAIHKVDREIAKYTKELNKATTAQKEISDSIAQFSKSVGIFSMNLSKGIGVNSNGVLTSRAGQGTPIASEYKTGDKTMDFAIATAINIYKDTGKVVNPGLIKGLIDNETSSGTSDVFVADNNIGGITWDESMGESRRGSARPANEGGYYEHFNNAEEATKELARVLELSRYDGLYNTNDPETFVSILKSGGYMTTDDLSGYVSLMRDGADKFAALGVSLDDIINSLKTNTNNINNVNSVIGGSITQMLNQAEYEGGLLNAEMPHLTEGCVEAVVRLGSWFSPALKEQFDNSIADVDSLITNLKAKGIEYDTTNTSIAQPGDILVVNGGGHVVMVKDAEHTVGNSSYSNPNTASGSGIMEQDMSYWMPRTVGILRTGNSAGIDSFALNGAHTADSGAEAYKTMQDEYISLIKLQSEVQESIYGIEPNIEAQISSLLVELQKYERDSSKSGVEKAALQRMKIRQQINKLRAQFYSGILDFVTSHLEYTAEQITNQIKYGEKDFNDIDIGDKIRTYFDYFKHSVDTTAIQGRIDELQKDAQNNKSIIDGIKLKSLNEQIKALNPKYNQAGELLGNQEDVAKLINERTKLLENLPQDMRNYKEVMDVYKQANDEFFIAKQKNKVAIEAKKANDEAIKKLNDLKEKDNGSGKYQSEIEEAAKAQKETNDKLWEANENNKGFDEAKKFYDEQREKMLKTINNEDLMEKLFHTKEIADLNTKLNNAKLRPAQWVAEYEREFSEAEATGNSQLAEEIRKKINSLKQKLFSIVENWIKTIGEKFDTMKTYFDSMPWITNLQKEQGDSLIENYRNQELYNADKSYYESLQDYYGTMANTKTMNDAKIAELEEKKRNSALSERADIEKEIGKLTSQNNHIAEDLTGTYEKMSDVLNKMRLEKLLGHVPSLLDEIHWKSKQALEDGLVSFLTDGVNEAESLKDALLDMAYNFLKTMQEFFAKKMVTSLMNMWFGEGYTTTGNDDKALEWRANAQKIYNDNANQQSFVVNYASSKGDIDKGVMYHTELPFDTGVNTDWLHKNDDYKFSMDLLDNKIQQRVDSINKDAFYNGAHTYATNLGNGMWSQTYTNPTDVATIANGYESNPAIEKISTTLDTSNMSDEQYHQSVTTVLQSIDTNINSMVNSLNNINMSISSASSSAVAEGHATGGFITGRGTSKSDSIPAMLSNGEYVISAKSVRKYGTNFMNAVNDGTFTQIPTRITPMKFADGGIVAAQETARGMTSFANNVGSNINATTNMNVALVSNQEEAIAHFMRSPRGQRIMLDFSRGNAKFSSHISNP